jgi:hypothetical protein
MVAAEYYAGGRSMNMDVLKRAFQGMFARGQQLQTQYAGAIQQKAQTLDAGEVMRLVRQS